MSTWRETSLSASGVEPSPGCSSTSGILAGGSSSRPPLSTHADVRFVYLFGSAAKGAARAESDVDVAVFFGKGSDLRERDSGTDGERRLERLEQPGFG